MSESDPEPKRGVPRWRGALQNAVLTGVLVALLITFGLFNSAYLSSTNLLTIVQAVSVMGVLATVQTVVIICGALDISVGSQAGVASVVSAMVFTSMGSNPYLGILAAIGVGMVLGLVNGLVIVYGRVNPVIATLGTLAAYKGVALVISNGRAQGFVLNDGVFVFISRGKILGLPTMMWIFILISLIVYVLLNYTDIGRNLYAIGGNDRAARLAGIDINRYLIAVYVFSGSVAAIAGVMLTAYTGSGQPTSGSEGLELRSITAAALGGAALAGGRGGVGGTVIAVLLLGSLENGLNVVGVNSFWQYVAQGALLIVAVVIQKRRTRERPVGLPT